jgi:hypothetical protein
MGFHRKWLRWRAVQHDEGYEVAFVRAANRVRKVRYSDALKSLTIGGEPVVMPGGKGKRRWGLHFALQDRYLQKWDNGSETTAAEREVIRTRIRASLEYMHVPYTIDVAEVNSL